MKQSPTFYFKSKKIPMLILMGLTFAIFFIAFFYITYAQNAWFFQDDFSLIIYYMDSVHINQLFDFSNFGRFISRNIYWHYGVKLFSFNAPYFYLFNLFLILSTTYIIYKIFSVRYGSFSGLIAGLFYFTLPATISCYIWLSNSQHIIGHFFVFLFVYLYLNNTAPNLSQRILHGIMLAIILLLGFLSNIFMSMVISLPVLMTLADKNYRKQKTGYLIAFIGIILFSYFYFKLANNQTGAYATSYTLSAVKENVIFYFKNNIFSAFWIGAITFGALYSFYINKPFIAWLFVASVAFFIPFSFFLFPLSKIPAIRRPYLSIFLARNLGAFARNLKQKLADIN